VFQAAVPGVCTCTNMEMVLRGRHREAFLPRKQSTLASPSSCSSSRHPHVSLVPRQVRARARTRPQVFCLRAKLAKEAMGRTGRGLPRGPVLCFQDSELWKQAAQLNLVDSQSPWRGGPRAHDRPPSGRLAHHVTISWHSQLPFPWPFFQSKSHNASSGLNAVASCCVGM